MAFGSTKRKHTVGDDAFEVDREVAEDADGAAGGNHSNDDGHEDDDAQNGTKNPIFAEVILLNKPKGKNDSGSRHRQCYYCNNSYKSSSTRIRQHFFGTQNGTKSLIARCDVLRNNHVKYQELYDKLFSLYSNHLQCWICHLFYLDFD